MNVYYIRVWMINLRPSPCTTLLVSTLYIDSYNNYLYKFTPITGKKHRGIAIEEKVNPVASRPALTYSKMPYDYYIVCSL